MKTRAVLALSALIASGFTAAASAAPKKPALPACVTINDPAKDDYAADLEAGEDPALDIVKVTESVKGQTVSFAMTVSKYGLPTYADGARYQMGFMHGGKLIEVFGTNSRSKPVVDLAYSLKGIRIDDTLVSGSEAMVTQVEDGAKNTITLSVSLANLSSAAGTKLAGQFVTAPQAKIYGVYTQILEPWDEAAAPPATKLKMADCK